MTCPHCNMQAPDTNYKCPHCGSVLKTGIEPTVFRQKPAAPPRSFNYSRGIVPLIFIVGAALAFYFFSGGSEEGKKTVGRGGTLNRDNPGEIVYIEDFVKMGKVTYFYFFSRSEMKTNMDYLNFVFESTRYKDAPTVIYKVDIDRRGYIIADYESPVAQFYDIKKVPYLIIYDESGEEIYSDVVKLKYDTGRR